MKLLITLLLSISSMATFAQGPQTWPDAFSQEDVDIIKSEIATPLSDDEIDAVIDRIQFPFRVAYKHYSMEEFKEKINEFLTPAMCAEMASSEYYEAIGPEGDSYMLVCQNSPEGYNGAVPIFKRIDDIWILVSLDLY